MEIKLSDITKNGVVKSGNYSSSIVDVDVEAKLGDAHFTDCVFKNGKVFIETNGELKGDMVVSDKIKFIPNN